MGDALLRIAPTLAVLALSGGSLVSQPGIHASPNGMWWPTDGESVTRSGRRWPRGGGAGPLGTARPAIIRALGVVSGARITVPSLVPTPPNPVRPPRESPHTSGGRHPPSGRRG